MSNGFAGIGEVIVDCVADDNQDNDDLRVSVSVQQWWTTSNGGITFQVDRPDGQLVCQLNLTDEQGLRLAELLLFCTTKVGQRFTYEPGDVGLAPEGVTTDTRPPALAGEPF